MFHKHLTIHYSLRLTSVGEIKLVDGATPTVRFLLINNTVAAHIYAPQPTGDPGLSIFVQNALSDAGPMTSLKDTPLFQDAQWPTFDTYTPPSTTQPFGVKYLPDNKLKAFQVRSEGRYAPYR